MMAYGYSAAQVLYKPEPKKSASKAAKEAA
jgi:hypothetical protein